MTSSSAAPAPVLHLSPVELAAPSTGHDTAQARSLAFPAPLPHALDVSQPKAALAHELGHLPGGDPRLGPLTYRAEMATARIVESLGHRGYVTGLFVAYWKFQRKMSAAVRRGQE